MAAQNQTTLVKKAVDITLNTIERRTRLFRNLVLGIVTVPLITVILAVYFRSFWALLGVSVVIPEVAIYLLLDARQVRTWAYRILEFQSATGIDPDLFASKVEAHPLMPKGTLGGMLGVLNDMRSQTISSSVTKKKA